MFLENSPVKVPGQLFGDEKVELYKLFSMKRGVFRSLFMPLWKGLTKFGLKGVVEGGKLGYETSNLAGDSWQQGGIVILDKEANIIYQHNEKHPADWPDMKDVLPLVGVNEADVDYRKAVDDWLKLREDKRNEVKSSSS